MRNISTTIASLAATSQILPESMKALAIARDTQHASYFEAAGVTAVYCISQHGTHLQFIGAHPHQAQLLQELLGRLDPVAHIYLITSVGADRISASEAMAAAGQRSFAMSGDAILNTAGQCIATKMHVQEQQGSIAMQFVPGEAFRESLTNLSALRQIAVAEAQKQKLNARSLKVLLGLRDITFPNALRAKALQGNMKGLQALAFFAVPSETAQIHMTTV